MGFISDFFRIRADTSTAASETNTSNTSNNSQSQIMIGDPGTINDVLLRAMINDETITKEMALTIPAVAAAVDLIAGMIASMPVRLYKYSKGVVEEITNDGRLSLLNADTGDTLNGFEWKKAMVTDYLLGRGGYSYIERDGNDIIGLYYVVEGYISILRSPDPIFKSFSIFCYDAEFQPYEFIRLLRNTKDGMEGVGVTEELSKSLQTAYQTLIYQLGLVKSGGNKRGFLKASRKIGQTEINTLKAAWRNLYMNNEENVVVLNNGIEFQEAANTSVEMQLNENKKTLNDEINNIFHINPSDFYETFKVGIYPICKAFEAALNSALLLEKEKGKKFFEFDVKEIIKANIKERYEAYRMAKEIGFMTKNEFRRMENMNEFEGLDVIDYGLSAVLFDVNTKTYYTPNMDAKMAIEDKEEQKVEAGEFTPEQAKEVEELTEGVTKNTWI